MSEILINQLDIGTRVVRALDAKGEVPKLTAGEYDLDILAEDLTLPEFAYCRRKLLFTRGFAIAAVAAQTSFALFGAPPGTGRTVLGVVEKVIVGNPGAALQTCSIGFSAQTGFAIPGGTPVSQRDDRFRQTGVAASSFYSLTQNNNAAPPAIDQAAIITLAIGASVEVQGPWILTNHDYNAVGSPTVLQIAAGNVNQALTVAVFWSERTLLPSELLGS